MLTASPKCDDELYGIEESANFAQQFLQRHNELRRLHGSTEFTLNDELCEMARDWAAKIASKRHISFAQISGIGENITVFPADKGAKEIVDYWYEENRKYEYETPGWQAGTNYFTQIVWKSTRELGVSRTIFDGRILESKQNSKESGEAQQQVVVVAFYKPAGNSNRSGQFELNVPKPVETTTTTIVNGVNNSENKY